MPRNLTTTIENESAKSRLRVVDLIRVKFPPNINYQYYANMRFEWDGHIYQPRVLTVGSWTRSANAETEDLSVTFGNADGEFTRISNTVDVELAELSLIRVYPDLDEAIDPLWTGYGGTMTLDEERAEWNVHFGFRGFTQKGIRKVSQNCWKQFADGVYCPYTGSGIGVASNLSSGIGVGDTTIAVNNNNLYAPGDIVSIDAEKMLIVGGTFDVIRGFLGTLITGHAAGTAVFHANCQKSSNDCNRRGMNGPPQPGAEFRWFGGWDMKTPITFKQRNAKGKKPKFFQQSSYGNDSLYGEPIPAVYGNSRLRSVPASASVDAKEFRHALFILCEGPISGIATTLIRMNGLPPDDIDAPGKAGYEARAADSCILWEGSTGQRASLGILSDTIIDTYDANPFLFSTNNGDGPSLSDVAALRIRIEEGGEEFSNDIATLDVSLTGRRTRRIESYIAEDPTNTTNLPNPIEAAVDYLVNGKFGARLAIDRIDYDAAQLQSWYCQETINSTDITAEVIFGTVVTGPSSTTVVEDSPTNWILVDVGVFSTTDSGLTGRTLKITTIGRAQTKVIANNFVISGVDVSTDNRLLHLGFVRDLGLSGVIVEIQGDWDAGKTPIAGDTVEISASAAGAKQVPRFRFDGVLHDDDSVEKQLAMILENCNGYYYARGDKLVLGIRKAEDLSAINALPALTDYGPNRNILRDDGKSSLTAKRASGMDAIANQIEVIFEDADNGFQETTLFVYDEDLQKHAGLITSGDDTRVINAKQLRLMGTATKDQALRLGALKLREETLKKDTYGFTMSLKDSLKLEPGDVRRLDSYKVLNQNDRQLSKRSPYVRIVKIEETDKFTASIEVHRHDNGVYDDTIHNLVGKIDDTGAENPANFPRDVIPFPPVETIEFAKDGTALSIINVEVTYPS